MLLSRTLPMKASSAATLVLLSTTCASPNPKETRSPTELATVTPPPAAVPSVEARFWPGDD